MEQPSKSGTPETDAALDGWTDSIVEESRLIPATAYAKLREVSRSLEVRLRAAEAAAQPVAPPASGAEVASLLITLHSAAKGGVQLDRFQIATIASLLESLTAQAEALRQERQKDAFDLRRYESAIRDLEQRASSLQAEVEAVKASGDGRVS